jgi:pilus assembly protein CpaF
MGIDADGRFLGQLKSTGIRPGFSERLANYGVTLEHSLFSGEAVSRRVGNRR